VYSWYKPRLIVLRVRHTFSLVPLWWWVVFAVVLSAAGAAGIVGASLRLSPWRGAAGVVAALLLMTLISCLPQVFAYPQFMFETVWLCLTSLVIVAAWLVMTVTGVTFAVCVNALARRAFVA
jgi:hypothetical protein